MKRTLCLIFCFCCFLSFDAFAQIRVIGTFDLSATGETFGVRTSINSEDNKTIYLDFKNPYKGEQARLILNNPDSFINFIKEVEETFVYWKSAAIKNNVSRLVKEMPNTSLFNQFYFSSSGKWYLDNTVKLFGKFLVEKDGSCYCIVETGKMKSAETLEKGVAVESYVDTDGILRSNVAKSVVYTIHSLEGAYLLFSSVDEMEEMINQIQQTREFKEINIEQGKLFKKAR